MINKKTNRLSKTFKAAVGGIYGSIDTNRRPTNIGQLGGDTSMGVDEVSSLQDPRKVNVVEDNTNYTSEYAMKGAQAGASLMAVNPVVGVVAMGVGAGTGAVMGALKEKSAKAKNRELRSKADTQQQIMNLAYNNDARNLAAERDNTARKNQKLRSINNQGSFYGQYNAKKGIGLIKANDGYFSNKNLGFKETEIPVDSSVNQKPAKSNNFAAFSEAGMQLADVIIDYNQKSKGYMYVAKKGMKLNKGGRLQQLSSDSSAIEGPSHENGGVDLTEVVNSQTTPNIKLEAEGKESMKDTPDVTMIFSNSINVPGSNKSFADVHKEIATKKGKIENKINKYAEVSKIDNKNAIKGLSYKLANLENQENMLFELQQKMNGDHSNETGSEIAKKGMSIIKSKKGSKLSKYREPTMNLVSGALQYYNLEKRVRDNKNAREKAIDQISKLNIPIQKRIDNVNLDYSRTDVSRAEAATQMQNLKSTIGASTSGNLVGASLTGLYGSYMDQNAKLLQEQENNRVQAVNASTMANVDINRANAQNAYESSIMRLERDRDVINDKANLVTDYNKEHSEYVTDNFRKEAFADKTLAYQYAGLSSDNQEYLQSRGLSPQHWTSGVNRVLGSYKEGGNYFKSKCGSKLVKAGFGGKFTKDCGC